MAAIVTDQFRILNATNFIESIDNPKNSYYAFLGLPNPTVGFGGTSNWDSNIPSPTDNFNYNNHYHDTMIFGKKITSSNVRRVIRRIDWSSNTKYEMYRDDYSLKNLSPITNSARLYDSNYYVMNSDYRVYICIDNGSSGTNIFGNASQDQPTFTDPEPLPAGLSGDGYLWKYLFTVSPSDIIKFDSTEYITVPSNWDTSTDPVKNNGDSTLYNNQIKKVYIDNKGSGYSSGEVDILGDGTGGKVIITTNSSGEIISTQVSSGGSGYTYGIVDLGARQPPGNITNPARLIPIIPPSKGHGYDIYKELGTDKVLVYARFDDSTKDFPTDTKFAQVGIVKNLTISGSAVTFTDNQYSSLYAIKFPSSQTGSLSPGDEISQITGVGTAKGYVASYDTETKVLKYFRSRSLYYGNSYDQTDYDLVSSEGKIIEFSSSGQSIIGPSFSGSIDTTFNSGIATVGNKNVSLGVIFSNGLASPEINKGSGDIIYIDNRPLVSRNPRQKEDVKIILEF
jgi:hypothetical protein